MVAWFLCRLSCAMCVRDVWLRACGTSDVLSISLTINIKIGDTFVVYLGLTFICAVTEDAAV